MRDREVAATARRQPCSSERCKCVQDTISGEDWNKIKYQSKFQTFGHPVTQMLVPSQPNPYVYIHTYIAVVSCLVCTVVVVLSVLLSSYV
jgi:hypothetical protein